MTKPDTCSTHGYHGGWFDCPRCEAERRHKESLEALERDQEARASEREDVRRRHEDLREELRQQREDAETRADEERERSREREQNVRLASTGKLKVQEDVRMAIRCLRQGDEHRAVRLIESALDAWPTYAWGWLASAELTVASGRDPSSELNRAGRNVIEDESSALFTLSLEAEFSAKLKSFVFDPAQEKLIRDDPVRYAFIAGLFSLDGGKTARRLDWVAPYPDIIGQFLLVVDPEALVAYERHLCSEIEGASGPATALNRTANVELALRLSGRYEVPGPRRSAFYMLSAWCEQVLEKEGAEGTREFRTALAAMERTVASLPWSEPKETLDRAKAIFDQRVRDGSARATAARLEQERQQKLEAERRAAAAAVEDKRHVVVSILIVGGIMVAPVAFIAATTPSARGVSGPGTSAAAAPVPATVGVAPPVPVEARVAPPNVPTAPRSACPEGMVHIPAGTFQMGEAPGRAVHVQAFCMDQTEVTTDAYAACVNSGSCSPADTTEFCNTGIQARRNHPINCVDWNQAVSFCQSRGARLPSEEEWEYGARGTDGRIYPWGNRAPGHRRLCWARLESREGTCPVGSFRAGASPFGLQDMAGNVWEWTTTPEGGDTRIHRGGSWDNPEAALVRATNRGNHYPSLRHSAFGFRCVRGE